MYKVGDRVEVKDPESSFAKDWTEAVVIEAFLSGGVSVRVDSYGYDPDNRGSGWVFSKKEVRPIQDNTLSDHTYDPEEMAATGPVGVFDQGGLKRMPDGTLESVHIPKAEEMEDVVVGVTSDGRMQSVSMPKRKLKDAEPMPYTANGTGGKPRPKTDFRVTVHDGYVRVQLREQRPGHWIDFPQWHDVDGCRGYVSRHGLFGRKRSQDKLRGLIAKVKARILADYDLMQSESGLV